MKTVLVFGASGFVGNNILEYFDNSMDYRFIAIVRRLPENNPHKSIHYYEGDLTEMDSIAKIVDLVSTNGSIDFVVHAASATLPNNMDPLKDINENVIPMIDLMKMLASKKITRLIYISSGGAVYGNVDSDKILEDLPKHPLSSYGIGKLFIETYIDFYARNYGIETIILRPSNLYGHSFRNVGKQGFINTALYNLANGLDINVWGDGTVVRDYLFIEDFIELFPLIFSNFEPGIYNVGLSKGYSINEIISILGKEINAKVNVKYLEGQKNAPQTIILDCGKVRNVYNWKANTTLEQGIKKLWNEIVNQQPQ